MPRRTLFVVWSVLRRVCAALMGLGGTSIKDEWLSGCV